MSAQAILDDLLKWQAEQKGKDDALRQQACSDAAAPSPAPVQSPLKAVASAGYGAVRFLTKRITTQINLRSTPGLKDLADRVLQVLTTRSYLSSTPQRCGTLPEHECHCCLQAAEGCAACIKNDAAEAAVCVIRGCGCHGINSAGAGLRRQAPGGPHL